MSSALRMAQPVWQRGFHTAARPGRAILSQGESPLTHSPGARLWQCCRCGGVRRGTRHGGDSTGRIGLRTARVKKRNRHLAENRHGIRCCLGNFRNVPCSRDGAPGSRSLAQRHPTTTTLPATIVATAIVTTAVWIVPTGVVPTGVVTTAVWVVATVVGTTAVCSPVNPAGVSMIIASLLQFRRGSSCAGEVPIHRHRRGTEGAAKSSAKRGNCRENAHPHVRHFALPQSPSFLDIRRLDPCTRSSNGIAACAADPAIAKFHGVATLHHIVIGSSWQRNGFSGND